MRTDRPVRLTTMDESPFVRRKVRLEPGSSRPYDHAEWDDALVIVTEGVIELEGLSGRRWRFPRGAILWLTDLPLRAIHNPAEESAELATVSRPINSRTPTRPT
jgi:hypothetical protein